MKTRFYFLHPYNPIVMKQFITRSLALLLLTFVALGAWAQDSSQVKLTYTSERLNDNEVLLSIKAVVVGEGKKLYSVNKLSEEAVYSSVEFDTAAKKFLKEPLVEKGNIVTEKDADMDGVEMKFATDSLVWQQKVTLPAAEAKTFEGKVSFLVKTNGEYKAGEEAFAIEVPASGAKDAAAN